MLRDRVVCGIRDVRLQRRLLAESELTFKKAFEICQATELAHKNTQNLQSTQSSQKSATMPIMTLQSRSGGRKQSKGGVCYRCNSNQHLAADCHFKSADCRKCGKNGHIAKACRTNTLTLTLTLTPTPTPQPKQKGKNFTHNQPQSTHQVSTDLDESAQENQEDQSAPYGLFMLTQQKVSPIMVQISLNQVEIPMELDTGASLSVISEMTYQKIWDGLGPPLQPTDVRLKTYTGETLQVKGKINVHVQYEGQEEELSLLVVAGADPSLLGRAKGKINVHVQYEGQEEALSLLVVAGAGPSLLGRDWLHKIKLNWSTLNHIFLIYNINNKILLI